MNQGNASRTSTRERLLLFAAVAVLIAGSAFDFSEFTTQQRTNTTSNTSPSTTSHSSSSSSAEYVTGTAVTETDTLFTADCLPTTSGGGFQFRIVSDSTGQPVSGETVNAVNYRSCAELSNLTITETQVVYVRTFEVGPDGWLTPDNPFYDYVGFANFTVVYEGMTYAFSSESAPPIGASCLTLHVPSGDITTTLVSTSDCWGE